MRLFLGIPLAAAVIGELSAISMRLRPDVDGLRWSAPESWHITLQFLGNTEKAQGESIVAKLRELRSPPVPVKLNALGFFRRSGILFAGVDVQSELLALHQRVIQATALCGYVPEARPFQPHITVARSKAKGSRNGLAGIKARMQRQPNFTRFIAEEFLLYESFLGSTGSRYEVRERFPFVGR